MKIFGIAVGILALVVLGFGFYVLTQPSDDELDNIQQEEETATSTDEEMDEEENEPESVIGQSVEGRDITAYHYGEGDTHLLFVGGIHGGYSWNTVLVAYELMDYLEANTDEIPEGVRVTVVPVMNPDGLQDVVGTTGRFMEDDVPASEQIRIDGRFNANNVDLNRNFDCEWSEESTWQSRTVSGGDAAFSEPEAAALRDFVENNDIDGTVVWYSAAGGVFASSCHNDVSSETSALTNLYADAAGYQAYESFDFYEITGDMVNWLARENIPAISVLLSTHEDVEWPENRAGVEAMFEYYADDGEEEDE